LAFGPISSLGPSHFSFVSTVLPPSLSVQQPCVGPASPSSPSSGHQATTDAPDERLSPNLLRGRGKSIGGDLDVDDEGSEQNVEPLQSLYHCSIGYQFV
jgi:hypothetical protein